MTYLTRTKTAGHPYTLGEYPFLINNVAVLGKPFIHLGLVAHVYPLVSTACSGSLASYTPEYTIAPGLWRVSA
jgi:hypothetical protein